MPPSLASRLLAAFAAAAAAAAVPPPFGLRVDLQESQDYTGGGHGLFVTLDAPYGVASNLTVSWALPAEAASQTSFSVVVSRPTSASSNASAVVVSATAVASAAQLFSFARARLAPATAYDVTVSATVTLADGSQSASGWSAPLRFFTSAGAALWAQSAPVWAPKCAGAPGPAQPSFAVFYANVKLAVPAASDGVLSALVYATAAPPIYNDPWNVTKLFSGFKLSTNGSLIGIGPGHTACGPYAMSSCAAVQPVDGFDVTGLVRGLIAEGAGGLNLDVAAFAMRQDEYLMAPGMQAVLTVRFSPEGSAPDLVVGTAVGAASAWSALDADGVYNPSGNKDSGWYTQPREDIVTSCIPGAGGMPGAGCAAPYGACAWAAPVAAPGAFGDYATGGTLQLAGKATQAVSVMEHVPFASATRLGPGWFLFDPGFELQGGFELSLAPSAAPAPAAGVRAVVQLSDELQANGSAMWNTRAGMHYRDTWSFPATDAGSASWWQLRAAHHEMSEFRYAELILTDAASGAPLDLDPARGDFVASLWVNRYRYDDSSATRVETTSPELDSVFRFAAFTLKTTSMDIYSDSNTRQRSFDCMADNNVAALNHYSTTSELALPRMMSAQVMAIGETGYVSGNWADWTVLPGLSVVYDALYSGDLSWAASQFDKLLANHTYTYGVQTDGLVHVDGLGALVDTSGGDDDGFQDSDRNAVVQAWSYLAMRRVAQLGRWIGRAADAARLDIVADALRAAVKAKMVNDTSGGAAVAAVCDGLCSATPHQSVHSTFYALYSGLFADNDALMTSVAAYVRARAVEDPVKGIPCGSHVLPPQTPQPPTALLPLALTRRRLRPATPPTPPPPTLNPQLSDPVPARGPLHGRRGPRQCRLRRSRRTDAAQLPAHDGVLWRDVHHGVLDAGGARQPQLQPRVELLAGHHHPAVLFRHHADEPGLRNARHPPAARARAVRPRHGADRARARERRLHADGARRGRRLHGH